ncbi:MAG: sulfite exporter TauE/SafE family protein [Oscillospiraceae bacterium]|nr:sulfite exporter TauE/SafE family protein [Oscillospiraceae bacterium]
MRYIITFLEGIISFISPCMLPMLPVYVTYFAGSADEKRRVFPRALSFVLGFTLVFSLLGLFAGTLGSALARYQTAVNIVCGAIVIMFGLSYLGVIPMNFLKGVKKAREASGIFSAFLFGMIYSLSLTPCVGAFLGSALMLAASEGGAFKGLLLLLVYSLGLGIPFVLSAVLIDKLRGAFDFIKRHYKVINAVCGVFLIIVGVAMALGLLGELMNIFS